MTARLTAGAVDAWNWEPLMLYMERHYETEISLFGFGTGSTGAQQEEGSGTGRSTAAAGADRSCAFRTERSARRSGNALIAAAVAALA